MTRDPRIVAAAKRTAEWMKNRTFGYVNVYTCDVDPSHQIVTVDREDGVTPFTTQCPICAEQGINRGHCPFYEFPAMTSSGYRVNQSLTPTYEWYRPDTLDGLSAGMVDHVLNGGLDLRRITN